jgi:hypothetical protein
MLTSRDQNLVYNYNENKPTYNKSFRNMQNQYIWMTALKTNENDVHERVDSVHYIC